MEMRVNDVREASPGEPERNAEATSDRRRERSLDTSFDGSEGGPKALSPTLDEHSHCLSSNSRFAGA